MVEVIALDLDKITRNARFVDAAPLYAITLIFVLQNKYLPRETVQDKNFTVARFAIYSGHYKIRDSKSSR